MLGCKEDNGKKDKAFIRDILSAIWIVGFDMEHEISYLEEIPSNIAKMPNPGK